VKHYNSSVGVPADRVQFGDIDRDGRVSFGELVLSTGFVVVVLFVGLLLGAVAVGGLLGVGVKDFWSFFVRWFLWSALLLSVAVGVGLGVWRGLRYERDERVRALELARRWRFEDQDRQHLNAVVDRETQTRFTQSDVDSAARLYLHRYYAGRGLSRDSWVKDGLSKDLWDHTNELMKKRGLRKGRKPELTPTSFADAWGLWCDRKMLARSWLVSDGEYLEKS